MSTRAWIKRIPGTPKDLARRIPLNYQVGHENVSFFCPIFLGHPKARAAASKASGCFMGGTQWCKGGAGKAEAAKLQDAGISLKRPI